MGLVRNKMVMVALLFKPRRQSRFRKHVLFYVEKIATQTSRNEIPPRVIHYNRDSYDVIGST